MQRINGKKPKEAPLSHPTEEPESLSMLLSKGKTKKNGNVTSSPCLLTASLAILQAALYSVRKEN